MNKKLIFIFIILIVSITITSIYFITQKIIKHEQIIINKYNNPIIPEGFKKVETENASWELDENGIPRGWNQGLVIEDSDGNQFVWVPCTLEGVDNTIKYGRYFVDNGNFKIIEKEKFKQNLSSDCYYYEDDIINFEILDSVKKYEGFYIARYEAGIEHGELISKNNIYKEIVYTGWNNGNLVIKENSNVWNYITVEKARKVSNELYNNESIKSYLITSYCYDTTLKWISEDINNLNIEYEKYGNYDLPWTNYTNAKENEFVTFKTGTNNKYCLKNIYDLLGNAGEITTEQCNNEGELGVIRDTNDNFAINRVSIPKYAIGPLFGFRVILIIK